MAVFDPNDLQTYKHDVYQHNIDWLCKQVQSLNDYINGVGDSDDGSDIPAYQPFYFTGNVGFSVNGRYIFPSGDSDYVSQNTFGMYTLEIANKEINAHSYTFIGFENGYLNKPDSQRTARDFIQGYDSYWHIRKKVSTQDFPILADDNDGSRVRNLYMDNNGVVINNGFDSELTYLYPSLTTFTYSEHSLWTGYYIETSNNNGVQIVSRSNVNNYATNGRFSVLKDFPAIINLPSSNTRLISDFVVNNNNTYNNTYNYTTNEGDTLTVNMGNGAIVVGGAGMFISFDDLVGALNIGLPDLNVSLGLDDDNSLTIPTYEEIKYTDVGDFHITPIHQIKDLPLAPSFDVNLDVSDLPDTIGYSVTEYLNIADTVLGVGGSALLLGALFFSFLWLKIKRR